MCGGVKDTIQPQKACDFVKLVFLITPSGYLNYRNETIKPDFVLVNFMPDIR